MADRLTYVGHATVLLRLGGRSVLTDPVLGPRVGHIVRHGPPPVPETLAPPLLVLISHAHRDHLDTASLARLSAGTTVVVPRGVARHLPRGRSLVAREVAAG